MLHSLQHGGIARFDVITYISTEFELSRLHSVIQIGWIHILSPGDTVKKQLFSNLEPIQIPYHGICKFGWVGLCWRNCSLRAHENRVIYSR